MKIHETFHEIKWKQCESCESCESEAFGCEWTSEASWVSQARLRQTFMTTSMHSTLPSCQDSISSPAMAWRHQQDWHWRKGNQGLFDFRENTFDLDFCNSSAIWAGKYLEAVQDWGQSFVPWMLEKTCNQGRNCIQMPCRRFSNQE